MRVIIIVLLIVFAASSGCSASINRYGYRLKDIQSIANLSECQIAIKNNAIFGKQEVEILGKIKAGDTGFSVQCDEAYVLNVFKMEACSLGADIINIIEEKHPDSWSTCYRAKAEFLRLKDRQKAKLIKSDPKYAPELVQKRSEETKKRAKAAIKAGIEGGITGGMMGGMQTSIE